MNMRHISCCVLFACASAAAQTRPAPSGAATLARGIFDQLSQAQTTSRAILAELSKSPPATQAAARLAADAAAQARAVLDGVDGLDAHYDSMNPQSQEALRRAWSIAMILDACGSSVRDASKLDSGGAAEMRTGAECALRRAAQLEETLAPFKGGPSAPASPRRPRSN